MRHIHIRSISLIKLERKPSKKHREGQMQLNICQAVLPCEQFHHLVGRTLDSLDPDTHPWTLTEGDEVAAEAFTVLCLWVIQPPLRNERPTCVESRRSTKHVEVDSSLGHFGRGSRTPPYPCHCTARRHVPPRSRFPDAKSLETCLRRRPTTAEDWRYTAFRFF